MPCIGELLVSYIEMDADWFFIGRISPFFVLLRTYFWPGCDEEKSSGKEITTSSLTKMTSQLQSTT